MVGQIDVGLAGGVESMSRNYGSRGLPTDVSPTLLGSTVKDARDCLMPMGITSENVAERYKVDRKSQDEFAVRSHSRASRAQKEGHFDWEIEPVTVQRIDEASGQPAGYEVTKDDGIRHGLTFEKVSALKPVFGENGKSTAGNSYVDLTQSYHKANLPGLKYPTAHLRPYSLGVRGLKSVD
jgi:acetyl-CoA acyltransferase 1